jgi:hypothetical protein
MLSLRTSMSRFVVGCILLLSLIYSQAWVLSYHWLVAVKKLAVWKRQHAKVAVTQAYIDFVSRAAPLPEWQL